MKNKFPMISGIVLGIIVSCVAICGYETYQKSIVASKNQRSERIYNENSEKNEQLTTEEKLEDFNYVYNILKDNYPYFEISKRKTSFDWLSNKENFEKQIVETNNDKEFYYKMNEIFTIIQNGHTNIISPNEFKYFQNIYKDMPAWNKVLDCEKANEKVGYWESIIDQEYNNVIPIAFKYVEGKYVATDFLNLKCDAVGIKEGSVLTRVNSLNVDEYVKSLIGKDTLKYDNKRKKLKLNRLSFLDNKEFEIEITVIDPNGTVINKKVKSVSNDKICNSYEIQKKSDNFTGRILKENKIAYLKVNSMKYGRSLQVLDFYKKIKDFPYLIIDIRGNGGGSDLCWKNNIVRPLIKDKLECSSYLLFREGTYIKSFIAEKNLGRIKSIKTLPSNKNYPKEISKDYKRYMEFNRVLYSENYCGFKGKIYLLVDDCVFSSAESFAAFSKATKFAELIGTTTGGDGIGFDLIVALMPNSGLAFRFTGDMALNPDGTANEETHTEPDIYCELKYDDFIKMLQYSEDDKIICPYDTVLNKVVELCK